MKKNNILSQLKFFGSLRNLCTILSKMSPKCVSITDFESYIKELRESNINYEYALDRIEQIVKNECENCCECTTEHNWRTCCENHEIQDIINNLKGKEE